MAGGLRAQTYRQEDMQTRTVASGEQQKLRMPVVSNAECASKYTDLFKRNVNSHILVQEHVCAGGELKKDSCNGDSGGPLQTRRGENGAHVLVGVVSAGTKKCGIGAPGIFTRITNYVQWIKDNVK